MASLRNTTSFHGVSADDLIVEAFVTSADTANWAQLSIDKLTVNLFAGSFSEARAVMAKLRDAMTAALGDAPASDPALLNALGSMVSQFDHAGCTCTFPANDCCGFAKATALLASQSEAA